ncbi:hypothetical protein [Luteimonas panaciterrae]|uniref:hypothetical protein n=1 Tax=Luteimonas panaciterrae TaxID=363885 RepID=UPI001CFC35C8|nr:hypothetical protein [Luteimonas panaciterrae]
MENPYQSPNSVVSVREQRNPALDDVVSGQKLVIYAILLYFVAAASRAILGPLALLPILICLGMSWVGIYKIGRGLGYPVWGRILLLLMMLVPLVGLLALVVLNSRATARLEKAGYSVGLMGARDY